MEEITIKELDEALTKLEKQVEGLNTVIWNLDARIGDLENWAGSFKSEDEEKEE